MAATKKKASANPLEFYSNILDQCRDFAQMKDLSLEEATLMLILNELRQIHFHFDVAYAADTPSIDEKHKAVKPAARGSLHGQ